MLLGSRLVLDGITLVTGMKPIKQSTFLMPEALVLAKNGGVSMTGITILSHRTTLQDYIAFAEKNMAEDAFEVRA